MKIIENLCNLFFKLLLGISALIIIFELNPAAASIPLAFKLITYFLTGVIISFATPIKK